MQRMPMSVRSKMMRPSVGMLVVPRGVRNSAMLNLGSGLVMRAGVSWTSMRLRTCGVLKNWPYTLGMHVVVPGRSYGR